MPNPYDCVAEVFNPKMAKELWTVNYRRVLPITLQDFALGSLLPAVMYMFRWGRRRGSGQFKKRFARIGPAESSRSPEVTVADVARVLSTECGEIEGFSGLVPQAVLSDLLLAFCLENNKHLEGRDQPVVRVFPTHYFASWIDLPRSVGNLRYVPEMLVAILANQAIGETLAPNSDGANNRFALGRGLEDNVLLSLLGSGVTVEDRASLGGESYLETPLDIDQLLAVRIAQACGSTPNRLAGRGVRSEELGTSAIENQYPVARRAAETFASDLEQFLAGYGPGLPRQALMQMLDACLSLGLSNMLLSTSQLLSEWAQNGRLPDPENQRSPEVFVDCSGGMDPGLRGLAEDSFDLVSRQINRVPSVLFCLRLLDSHVRVDSKLRKLEGLPQPFPDASAWINFLGDLYSSRHRYAERILDKIDEATVELAESLEQHECGPEAVQILRGEAALPNPVLRMAEALRTLMGEKQQWWKVRQCLDSCLQTFEANGFARYRKSIRNIAGKQQNVELRSLTLPNVLLDFLVHRHLISSLSGADRLPLSFDRFLAILREKYGLYVDQSPIGQNVPGDALQRNRRLLEKRLRDLGVLVGVNDAESMKRLRPRFDYQLSSEATRLQEARP